MPFVSLRCCRCNTEARNRNKAAVLRNVKPSRLVLNRPRMRLRVHVALETEIQRGTVDEYNRPMQTVAGRRARRSRTCRTGGAGTSSGIDGPVVAPHGGGADAGFGRASGCRGADARTGPARIARRPQFRSGQQPVADDIQRALPVRRPGIGAGVLHRHQSGRIRVGEHRAGRRRQADHAVHGGRGNPRVHRSARCPRSGRDTPRSDQSDPLLTRSQYVSGALRRNPRLRDHLLRGGRLRGARCWISA